MTTIFASGVLHGLGRDFSLGVDLVALAAAQAAGTVPAEGSRSHQFLCAATALSLEAGGGRRAGRR